MSEQTPDPFQSTWRQEYWYNEAVREKRLNLLLHLAPYSAALLVTGDEGSGKTTLLHQFLARAHDTWRICSVQGAPDIDHLTLLDVLDQELSLRSEAYADEDDRVRHLRDSLHALRRGSLVPIVVIDDAHLLSQAALTMVGRLTEPREDGEILLGAILCGEPSLEERFTLPGLGSLRERVSHSFDIPAFTEEGTAEFIRHRMRVAGRDPDDLFTPAVLKFIHVASKGQPGRINELARGVLRNEKQPVETVAPPSGLAGRVLLRYGLAALAISLVVVALFYQDTLKEFGRIDPTPVIADSGTPQALPLHPPAQAPDPDEAADPDTGSGAEPDVAIEDAGTSGAPADEEALAPSQEQPAVAGSAESAVESAADPVLAAAPEDMTAPEEATSLPEEAPAASAPPVASPAVPPRLPEPPDAGAPGPRGDDWLLAQPPSHYTLQLFASSEARARDFIKQHALEDGAAIFRTTGGVAPLHAVVYGSYPSRQAAVTAAGQPEIAGLKGVEPWIRSLRVVQDVIGARQE